MANSASGPAWVPLAVVMMRSSAFVTFSRRIPMPTPAEVVPIQRTFGAYWRGCAPARRSMSHSASAPRRIAAHSARCSGVRSHSGGPSWSAL